MTPQQEKLVLSNNKLIWYVINRMIRPFPSDAEDWHSIGMIGLIKAAYAYDSSRGTQFSTVAVRYIQSEIWKEQRRLLASKRRTRSNVLSLDDPISDQFGNARTVSEIVSDPSVNIEKSIVEQEQARCLCDAVSRLTDRERMILSARLDGARQRNIAQKLQISQVQVSRLERKAIAKLRKMCHSGVVL